MKLPIALLHCQKIPHVVAVVLLASACAHASWGSNSTEPLPEGDEGADGSGEQGNGNGKGQAPGGGAAPVEGVEGNLDGDQPSSASGDGVGNGSDADLPASAGLSFSLPVGSGCADAAQAYAATGGAPEQFASAQCSTAVIVKSYQEKSNACPGFSAPLTNGQAGELSFAGGVGLAELAMDAADFAGNVSSCAVALSRSSTFTWEDGCLWTATETIGGNLDGVLNYAYTETSSAADPSTCASPCNITGTLTLQGNAPLLVTVPPQ